MAYHFIPVRMAIINKNTNNKYWGEYGEERILVHCWWKCKLVQSLWKTLDISQKTKNKKQSEKEKMGLVDFYKTRIS